MQEETTESSECTVWLECLVIKALSNLLAMENADILV